MNNIVVFIYMYIYVYIYIYGIPMGISMDFEAQKCFILPQIQVSQPHCSHIFHRSCLEGWVRSLVTTVQP